MEGPPSVPNSEEEPRDDKEVSSGDHDAHAFWEEPASSEDAEKTVPGVEPAPILLPALNLSPRNPVSSDSWETEELKPKRAPQPGKSADPQSVDNSKIGLLGGRNTGKTYFFNGIIYRTLTHQTSGAVSYYLRSSSLQVRQNPDNPGQPVDLFDMVTSYEKWTKYLATALAKQKWYRLNLAFQTGLIGKRQGTVTLEFLDGSGEGFTQPLNVETEPTWRRAFANAGIMIFCLPIWAAFPAQLDAKDKKRRDEFLRDFFTVVKSYGQIRVPGLKVRTILALTHADDDERCSLNQIIQKWIHPFLNDPKKYLTLLGKRTRITRYLASAQAVSNYLHEEFNDSKDRLVARIPAELDFGYGRPWIIPISAVEGKILDRVEAIGEGRTDDPRLEDLRGSPPIPVHVELPLLAALCETHNALM